MEVNGQEERNNDILVYPNPFDHFLYIDFISASTENATIKIFDISNKEIFRNAIGTKPLWIENP